MRERERDDDHWHHMHILNCRVSPFTLRFCLPSPFLCRLIDRPEHTALDFTCDESHYLSCFGLFFLSVSLSSLSSSLLLSSSSLPLCLCLPLQLSSHLDTDCLKRTVSHHQFSPCSGLALVSSIIACLPQLSSNSLTDSLLSLSFSHLASSSSLLLGTGLFTAHLKKILKWITSWSSKRSAEKYNKQDTEKLIQRKKKWPLKIHVSCSHSILYLSLNLSILVNEGANSIKN